MAYPNQLLFEGAFGWAAFDASRNGTITAQEQAASLMSLRWYDRSGLVLKTLGEPEYSETPRLDAQETHLLLGLFSPRTHAGDIWSLDLEHGTRRRESFQDRPGPGWSVWTRDGGRIVYSVLLGTKAEMFIKTAGGSNNEKMIQTELDGSKIISDVSPDGNWILYQEYEDTGAEPANYGQSLIDGKRFLIGPATPDELPRLSPDGGWVAAPSNESGSVEIIVRPFAPGAAAVRRSLSAVGMIRDGAATARNSFTEPTTGTSSQSLWLISNSITSVSPSPCSSLRRERNTMWWMASASWSMNLSAQLPRLCL